MKNFKYLIFIFIIFICPNVFATETNVSSKIKYTVDYSGGTYAGDEIALGGYTGAYSIGTRYNGRLSMLSFYLSSSDYDFLINHTYSITLNMATEDWRNNFMGPQVLKVNSNGSLVSNGALSVSNFRFVSLKQIKFNFTTDNSISPYYYFRLYSTDYATNNTVAITGVNNWALSSVIINDQVSTSGSGSSGSSGSGSNINNNTLTCSNGLTITSTTYTDSNINITGSYINSSGNLVSNSGYNVINYIPIKPNTNYQIKKTTNSGDVPSYCLSTSKSSYGSCTAYNQNNTFTFNSGDNTYLSLSIKPDETIYLSYCASSIEIDNQNTQNIINNNTQNTTDIINNQNQNTQIMVDEIKKGQLTCGYNYHEEFEYNDLTNSGVIDSASGSIIQNDYFRYSDYTPIFGGNVYDITGFGTGSATSFYITALYDSNFNYLTFFNYKLSNTIDLSNYSGLLYIRVNVNSNSNNRLIIVQKDGICVPSSYLQMKQNEATKNAINDVNDTLNNSNIDSNTGTGFFDDFTSDDFGLSQIITIPLNTIQSLTSKSCVPLSVPIPFTNSNVSLPCMTTIYETNFPSIYNLWKIVSFGIVAYLIAIDIFHIVKGFKDPESDKVEVLDL